MVDDNVEYLKLVCVCWGVCVCVCVCVCACVFQLFAEEDVEGIPTFRSLETSIVSV